MSTTTNYASRDPEDDEDDIEQEPDDPDAWRDYCDDPYGDEVDAEDAALF